MNDLKLNINDDNLELFRIIKHELNDVIDPKRIFKVLTKYLDNDEVMMVLGIGRNTFYNYKRFVKGNISVEYDTRFNYIEKKLFKFRILLITNELINKRDIIAW